MTRNHGRCARGGRLIDRVSQGRWKTMIFLAALRWERIDAPLVLDGRSMAKLFLANAQPVPRQRQ